MGGSGQHRAPGTGRRPAVGAGSGSGLGVAAGRFAVLAPHEPAGTVTWSESLTWSGALGTAAAVRREATRAVREMADANRAIEEALAVADLAAFARALRCLDAAEMRYDEAAVRWEDVSLWWRGRDDVFPAKPERCAAVRVGWWRLRRRARLARAGQVGCAGA